VFRVIRGYSGEPPAFDEFLAVVAEFERRFNEGDR
jgi:hypothetical protein